MSLDRLLNAHASDLQVLSDACGHIQNVAHEVAILKLGESAVKESGTSDAIDTLEKYIELCSSNQKRYELQVGLRTLGNIAKGSDRACELMLRLVTNSNFEVRFGAILGLRTTLRSTEIIMALKSLQQTGKFVDFERYQRLIHHVQSAVDKEENHMVRLAALETLTDLVQNLHSESIVCVSRCLSDSEETIRKISAEMLGDALLRSRETKRLYAGNIYIEEGFSKLLDAAISCFRCGQANENSDGYLRRIAINSLVLIVDYLDATDASDKQLRRRLQSRKHAFDVPSDTIKRRHVLQVLSDGLRDDYRDIRELAASKMLALAEAGDMAAADSVLKHIDTCFELGFGRRDLGCSQTQRKDGNLSEPPIMGADGPKSIDPNAPNEPSLPVSGISVENTTRRNVLLDLKEMAEKGHVSKIRDIAFPFEEQIGNGVIKCEDNEIRSYAAETLMAIATKGDENATEAVLHNLDTFFLLTGMESLGTRSALACASLKERDHGALVGNAERVTVLTNILSGSNEDPESCNTELSLGSAPRAAESPNQTEETAKVVAAVELLTLAEKGDPQASMAIIQNLTPFLASIGQAGIFRGKLRSASQALRGFID